MRKAIFGGGGHAREVAAQIDDDFTFFVDDEYASVSKSLNPISLFDPTEYSIMIAVGDPIDRERIVKSLPINTIYFTYIHPTVIILKNVKIGVGSFIGANSILTCDITIGNHCILNRGNHIGHDCVIGDYFSAMPGSILSGNVTIGDYVYIGTNSSIREKISICDNVKIGLNCGIVKDIEITGTYITNRKL